MFKMSTVVLPPEVLEKIFDFLSPSQITGAALVCRYEELIYFFKKILIHYFPCIEAGIR